MIERVWNAYRVEIAKATRRKFTYLGPLLLLAATISMAAVCPIERDGAGDYAFVAYALPLVLNLLGLIVLLIYCASLVSSELGQGTICSMLLRPLRRHEFIIAKILLGMSYATLLTVEVSLAGWFLVVLLGDLTGISFGGEAIHTHFEMVNAFTVGAVLSLLPQFGAVVFAIMISTMTRSTGTAAGASVGIWLLVDLVKNPLQIAPFVFSSYVESSWRVFSDRCNGLSSEWFPDAGYLIVTSLVSIFLFAAVAIIVMSRRNLQS